MKTAAVTGAVGALGLGAAHNMKPSDKAWADNDVHEVRTSCRACIANCGVIATVSNGRVIKLRGDSIDPMSKGRMCPKGLSGIQALYHPNRNKYPMKRVGAKPGNQWERISWDEAAKTVAQHMIDMRDKTGKHGLLCTTGGGGNPQFFSPPRFRNFWGAGNVFEPGCAQCYLPRNFTMPLVNGIGDTSIADSGCSELYKPAKYGGLTEVYVIWGTGPAWHSPSTSGRCVAELRDNGCKTVVVDPRFTADASKADVWLPIKPGTDMAMMLGWMHYIIENKLYEKIPGYETFCEQWTNLPFLVDPRDNVSLPPVAENITKDGQLLRASAVFDDVNADNEGYVYFDTEKGQVTKAFALGPDNDGTYHPQLFGTVDVTLADGSTITCKTAFQAYKDRCADFDLDTVAEITGCKKEKIDRGHRAVLLERARRHLSGRGHRHVPGFGAGRHRRRGARLHDGAPVAFRLPGEQGGRCWLEGPDVEGIHHLPLGLHRRHEVPVPNERRHPGAPGLLRAQGPRRLDAQPHPHGAVRRAHRRAVPAEGVDRAFRQQDGRARQLQLVG